MIVDQVVAAHERYRRDGFYLCPEPVLPADVVEQAVAGMDALRAGTTPAGRRDRPPGTPAATPACCARSRCRRSPATPSCRNDGREGVTEFIDDPGYCPVIFGDAGESMW